MHGGRDLVGFQKKRIIEKFKRLSIESISVGLGRGQWKGSSRELTNARVLSGLQTGSNRNSYYTQKNRLHRICHMRILEIERSMIYDYDSFHFSMAREGESR